MSCEGVGVWVRKAPDRGKGRCKGAKGRSGEELGSGGRRAAAMCPDEAECQQGPVMKGDMCLESHLDALLRKGDRTAMDSHGRRLLPQGNDEWRYFRHSAGPPDWMMKEGYGRLSMGQRECRGGGSGWEGAGRKTFGSRPTP